MWEVLKTHRSVTEVPDPTLQNHGPPHGGVDQAPAGVDEIGRRICVNLFIRNVSCSALWFTFRI